VIAIHGVGDHQPFQMAQSVVDMLEDLERAPDQPRYCAFGERKIRLNVAPVKVREHAFRASASARGQRLAPSHPPLDENNTWGALLKAKRTSIAR
jgi:hypothetical protein